MDSVEPSARSDGNIDDLLDAFDAVHRYVSRLTGGDVALTEDVVQDTYLVALRRMADTGNAPIGIGWLITVARHRLVDRVRQHERELARERRSAAGQLDEDPGSEVSSVSSEQARWLLQQLPPGERIALALQVVDGFTIAEVAELTGRTVEATSSLLARARRRLRALLTEARDD